MPYSAGLIRAKEETEARTVYGSTDVTKADSPAYQSLAYREMIADVVMMREVAGGTKSMRKAGDKYLPQHPMEQKGKYKDRLKVAVAYNALKRTIGGLVGMVFRRDPVLSEEVEARIVEELDNVDQRGSSLGVFMRGVGEGAMRDGHSWIHVETPPDNGEVRTRAQEEAAGVRPYWIQVSKAQAINWRYEIRGGRPVLTLFAYTESAVEADGPFGEIKRDRVRVLREVTEGGERQIQGELWQMQEEAEGERKPRWERIEGPYVVGNMDEIPVVFVPADPASPEVREFMSEPPLRDLAYEQIEHYRVRSDRQFSMTFASVAVPYLFGKEATDAEGNPKVTWGPDGMLLLNDPEATAGILESKGHGLSATKEELQEIEGRMAALGLQMLVGQANPQPQTATERILDKAESDAALALFAQSMESAANRALALHYKYRRKQPAGAIVVNTDFHDQLIDAALLRVYADMVATGDLSLMTLWEMMVEGEALPEDFDPEEERERIAEEAGADIQRTQRAMFGQVDDEDEEEDEEEDEGDEPPVAA